MGTATTLGPMSADAYLEWERGQLEKHEYHRGEVFAMAGGSPRHNYLCALTIVELHRALSGKKCRVLTSDQRIGIPQGERFVYPDVVVVCGAPETRPGTSDVITNPSLVVEVLSPSSEAHDRCESEKWAAYQTVPSLKDYLLVAQSAAAIEHYQRDAGGSWRYRKVEAGGTLTLSNGATLSVDAIYEDAFDTEPG